MLLYVMRLREGANTNVQGFKGLTVLDFTGLKLASGFPSEPHSGTFETPKS
jgi:hypothetical protein